MHSEERVDVLLPFCRGPRVVHRSKRRLSSNEAVQGECSTPEKPRRREHTDKGVDCVLLAHLHVLYNELYKASNLTSLVQQKSWGTNFNFGALLEASSLH